MLSLAGNNSAFKELGYWDRSGWNSIYLKLDILPPFSRFITTANSPTRIKAASKSDTRQQPRLSGGQMHQQQSAEGYKRTNLGLDA